MKRPGLYFQAAALAAAGLSLAAYKVAGLGFPLAPDAERQVWTVQARFTIDGREGPVKATLQVPADPPGFTVLDENFVSRGYGLTVNDGDASREAAWAIRRASGRQTLYYRATVVAGGGRRPPPPRGTAPDPELEEPFRTAMLTLIDEARAHSADTSSFTADLLHRLQRPAANENVSLFLKEGRSPGRLAQVAATLLAGAGVHARVVYGLPLEDRRRFAAFVPWLEVWDGARWQYFDPRSGDRMLPEGLFIWWRGDVPLIDVRGASNPEVEVSVWADQTGALELAQRRAGRERSRVVEFSLLSLPVQTQAVYGVLLLVPVGAFVMVVLRNVVGMATFGTFMPILIALAFRETRLLSGVMLFALVMALGLSLRFYLERLRLLLVPRLAAVLILVLLVLAAVSVLSHRLGIEVGLSVALFPVVILTMAIERMSIVWEERGAGEAIREAAGTLVVAAIAYAVMNLDLIEHLTFVFPELLLVLLAATILLGRYSGYRLLELTRFRVLAGR